MGAQLFNQISRITQSHRDHQLDEICQVWGLSAEGFLFYARDQSLLLPVRNVNGISLGCHTGDVNWNTNWPIWSALLGSQRIFDNSFFWQSSNVFPFFMDTQSRMVLTSFWVFFCTIQNLNNSIIIMNPPAPIIAWISFIKNLKL